MKNKNHLQNITLIRLTGLALICQLVHCSSEKSHPADDTESATEDTGSPTDDPDDPTDDTDDPTDDTDDPTDDTGDPTDDPGDPTDDPGDPTDDPGDPTDDTVENTDDDTDTVLDTGIDTEQWGPSPESIDPAIRLDHFGYRPDDQKRAVVLGHDGALFELRTLDHAVQASFTSGDLETDDDSGDSVSIVDFSAFTQTGDYYLALPDADIRSYIFRISPSVYDIVGAVAMKSFYYQRCNHDRALPYASDAVGSFAGIGGEWVDGSCHGADFNLEPGPDSEDNGTLDLHGGWHDAGDYQKTLWGRGVPEMLFAFEINPSVWRDAQLNIPESGNGIPDLLDELRWELDFYVRMQRPDGHFMTSAKGHNSTVSSPASASDEERVYFDTTSPEGDDWSGGGVTLEVATGNAVLSLAHAAIVFDAIGETAVADGYESAALSGWAWLDGASPDDDAGRRLKVAAAAAVYRLDPTVESAWNTVESFDWEGWDGLLPSWSATPNEFILATGAWHVLLNPSADAGVLSTIESAVAQVYVDGPFSEAGVYGGLYGGPGNGWDWSWGSNRTQSSYGAGLMMASQLGIVSSYTEEAVRDRAETYLHYLLGLNPLNMVYLSNMGAYGGEHSSVQMYHSWFSCDGDDCENGNPLYNGKPESLTDPLYPYYRDDDATATYGPAPGLLVGGPNYYYGGAYDIPNRDYPAYAYRDFSVACDWDGSACLAASWEITEPMAAYQGPFILLVSFFMNAD